MSRRPHWLTCSPLLVLTGGAPPAASPAAFVASIYQPYELSDAASSLDPSRSNTIFSPSLLRLIRADQRRRPGDVGKLDQDPLCACQDPGDFRLLSSSTRAISPRKALADVTFSLGPHVLNVSLDLLKVAGSWRVNDVSEPGIRSLRAFLTTP